MINEYNFNTTIEKNDVIEIYDSNSMANRNKHSDRFISIVHAKKKFKANDLTNYQIEKSELIIYKKRVNRIPTYLYKKNIGSLNDGLVAVFYEDNLSLTKMMDFFMVNSEKMKLDADFITHIILTLQNTYQVINYYDMLF